MSCLDVSTQLTNWRQEALANALHHGIPEEEVDILLEQGLGWSKLDRSLGRPPFGWDPYLWQRIQAMWQRRLEQRIPLHYLLGYVDWRDLRLRVTPDVLIPRPETELLVDRVLDWLETHPSAKHQPWIDLGTGSGALALALAQAGLTVIAVDISPAALRIAEQNGQSLGLDSRVTFLAGSWFEPLHPWRGEIGGMVANPPYIPSLLLPDLQPEVFRHEPHLALDGGTTGLNALTHLIAIAPKYLAPAAFWGVEVMAGQAAWVAAQLLQNPFYADIQIANDLAGIPRFVTAQIATPPFSTLKEPDNPSG
ncbi:MAG: peptide chain release factor N(5)-glutamine methyltransferase [Cyanobacteriota bacterium]|nr:peptide chain release factor N(5)-glutamine methyltransferase [Cyanobacteriota bacterium]